MQCLNTRAEITHFRCLLSLNTRAHPFTRSSVCAQQGVGLRGLVLVSDYWTESNANASFLVAAAGFQNVTANASSKTI